MDPIYKNSRTANPHSTLFIYLVKKYIQLFFLDFLSPSSFIPLQNVVYLTFMHHASYIRDRRTATPHSTLFIYLVKKYIQLFFLDFLSRSLFIPSQNVTYLTFMHHASYI